MELREFVNSSLIQIVDGVLDTQKELKERGIGAVINPGFAYEIDAEKLKKRLHDFSEVLEVEFDVGVIAGSQSEARVGGRLAIVVASVGTTKLAHDENQQVNRIRFKVPLTLPRPDKT